ncbi:FAD binding domain-containing protein [Phaeosphaeria sp. MPI-PUGE-AT-0046c]|nr:FAD binding domain-containing protein [Phaeosphaeria sp. MPI-PUGE-AT-0046c]
MAAKTLESLQPELSPQASITTDVPSRWSTFKAPQPVAVVNVSNEDDVVATVRFCNNNSLPFLAQNGGNGWAAFPQTKDLVIINLCALNTLEVAADKKIAVIGGGARVKEIIDAADAADVCVMTGNCNSVGVLGASLGGGYGNLMGRLGFGVDTIQEMRVVTASGELRTVSATQDEDLFWAMRGAGPNFGIVTSATVNALSMSKDERMAWSGALIFTDDKLEAIVEAIDNLQLEPETICFMYFSSSGPPNHAPVVIVTLWQLHGTPESGKAFFRPFFDIGPMMDTTRVLPYTEWNSGANPFCEHMKRKPAFGAGFGKMDPKTWRDVWHKYVEFQQKPGAHGSVILLEAYPPCKSKLNGAAPSSFPHRSVRFNAAVMPWYDDEALDEEGVTFGKAVRELWQKNSGLGSNASYVNFLHGDEPLEEIYGDSLPRLQELKHKWDPENKFNQWFNIQ